MNVTFHTITGLATAAFLASRQRSTGGQSSAPSNALPVAIGFVGGIFVHGMLDYVPHSYPIKSIVDVAVSLALFFIALLLVGKRWWLLFSVSFLGSVFPDLIDLGPSIMNKHFGWSLPTIKAFPWHWPRYSGSIYDGSRSSESLLYHLLVIGTSVCVLWAYRKLFFRKSMLRSESNTGTQPKLQETRRG